MKLSLARFAWAAILLPFAATAACGNSRDLYIGEDCESGFCDEPPAFTPPSADAGEGGIELKSYCPSNRCPVGHTTCPLSEFACDVDLLTDRNNCGECGNACPRGISRGESYACVDGRCLLACDTVFALDCDGVPDNGCETPPGTDDHCGVCGRKCPADKPCVDRSLHEYECGCSPEKIYCPTGLPAFLFPPCVDPNTDDQNCGACANACPPEGDGGTIPPNSYFGCHDAKCGVLKCQMFFGECDALPETGCETLLVTNDNCGECGHQCQGGTQCRLNENYVAECLCPVGQTFCEQSSMGDIRQGTCVDLTSDTQNCGACGARCAQFALDYEACVYGKCEMTCSLGRGDCNGNRNDGCETNIASDPKNCGACGHVCDAIAGQACVGGQCMVEPCDELQDAGGPAR